MNPGFFALSSLAFSRNPRCANNSPSLVVFTALLTGALLGFLGTEYWVGRLQGGGAIDETTAEQVWLQVGDRVRHFASEGKVVHVARHGGRVVVEWRPDLITIEYQSVLTKIPSVSSAPSVAQ